MSTGWPPGSDDRWAEGAPVAGQGVYESPDPWSGQEGMGEPAPPGAGPHDQPTGDGSPWQPGPYGGRPLAGEQAQWQQGPCAPPWGGPGWYGPRSPQDGSGQWQAGPHGQPPQGQGGPGRHGQPPPQGENGPWLGGPYGPPPQGENGPWLGGPYGPPPRGAMQGMPGTPGMYGSWSPPGAGPYGGPQRDQYYVPPPVAPYSSGKLPGGGRKKAWRLLAAGAVTAVVAAAAAAYVLTLNHGQTSRNTPAGSARNSSPPGPAAAASPPVVGAEGNVAAPAQIGSLRFNPVLTQRFITSKLKRQISDDFGAFPNDVVGGFYTSDPAAANTSKHYQLWFDVAYLSGTGHSDVALRAFLANRSLQSPAQIPVGPMGGKAACAWLQVKSGRLAHCMWVDNNTYADFYAWGSSRAALAETMLAARPHIEIRGGGPLVA